MFSDAEEFLDVTFFLGFLVSVDLDLDMDNLDNLD